MEYRICDARPGMIPAIAALEKEVFNDPWSEYALFCHLPDENHEFLVIMDEEYHLIGYACFMVVLDTADIANVAVQKDHQRQGLADRLIDECVRRAGERGLSEIYLEVRQSNEPALALYRKHGFVEVGRRKNYYEKPREDAILMTLFLKENEEQE